MNEPKTLITLKAGFLISLLVLVGAAWVYLELNGKRAQDGTGSLTIDGRIRVRIDIAATPATRTQGLSGRDPLASDQGMLFLFDVPDRYPFWMKDMRFPLDMLWIRQGKIVDMSTNVPVPGPDGSLPTYSPAEPADAVLEVPAGFAAAHGLKAGLPVIWRVDR